MTKEHKHNHDLCVKYFFWYITKYAHAKLRGYISQTANVVNLY